MRHPLTIVLAAALIGTLSGAFASCASQPVTDEPAAPAKVQPSAQDPDRVTHLEFYGGRCAGTPSSDGIEGVTGVELEVGKMFVAELYLSAGTGYEWKASGLDESVAKLVEERTRPTRGSTEVGSQQLHTMNFVAQKPGRTRVTFELRRPWEKDEKPAEIRHTTIYVK